MDSPIRKEIWRSCVIVRRLNWWVVRYKQSSTFGTVCSRSFGKTWTAPFSDPYLSHFPLLSCTYMCVSLSAQGFASDSLSVFQTRTVLLVDCLGCQLEKDLRALFLVLHLTRMRTSTCAVTSSVVYTLFYRGVLFLSTSLNQLHALPLFQNSSNANQAMQMKPCKLRHVIRNLLIVFACIVWPLSAFTFDHMPPFS